MIISFYEGDMTHVTISHDVDLVITIDTNRFDKKQIWVG